MYRQLGVEATTEVMRYLVDQASNRPGLAATLASAWHRGDFSAVLLGAVLERNLAVQLEGFLGSDVRPTLALLALGGDLGLSSEVTREKLELTPGEFHRLVTGLAAGGVLRQGPQGELSVWPRALRWSVAKSQLFEPEKPRLIDPLSFLEDLVGIEGFQPRQALITLLNVRFLGGAVPSEFLYDWVERFGSPDERAALAMVGPAEAWWVLERYQDDLANIAEAALRHQREATLERLLQRFAEEPPQTERTRSPRSAAGIFVAWVADLNQLEEDLLARRRAVLTATHTAPKLSPEKAAELVCLVVDPGLERESLDPGLGASFTYEKHALDPNRLLQAGIWREARRLITTLDTPSWSPFAALLWELAEPGSFSFGMPLGDETEAGFRHLAGDILRDLSPLAQGNTAVSEAMRALAKHLGIDLPLEPDEVFQFLYPPPRADFEEPDLAGVPELAGQWALREPTEIAALVARYQEASRVTGRDWPERLSAVLSALATTTKRPEAFFHAFLQAGLAWNLAAPFLQRLLQLDQARYFDLLTALLEDPGHQRAAAAALIYQEGGQAEWLHRVIGILAQSPENARFLALRGEIPVANLLLLLTGTDSRLAAAVAYGEWRRESPGQIRAELIEAWREAVRCFEPAGRPPVNDLIEASVGDLLEADPELAFTWLRRRLTTSPQEKPLLYRARDRSPWARAALGLSREQRAELLMSASWFPRRLLGRLVGEEPALFELALQRRDLPGRLEPLARKPDAAWEALVLAAADAGEVAQTITAATFPAEHHLSGSGVDNWTSWKQAFARFETHPDPSLREVARLGQQRAQAEIQEARGQERREALEGLDP